jgi:hypothetical protein
MQAHGTLFMSNTRPEASTEGGTFRLTLRLIDVLSNREKEAVQVRWEGPAAAAWWRENAPLKPGTPVRVELERVRAYSGSTHPPMPELRARVVHLALAPRHQAERQPA